MRDETRLSDGENREEELSRRWREESERYVSAINEYVHRGIRDGWDNVDERDEPKDARQPMAAEVLNAVRRANESGKLDGLRDRFPPAHGPFIEMLHENGQSLPVVLLLDDGRIVLQVGSPYMQGRIALINDCTLDYLPSAVISVGRSPNRDYFAKAYRDGVTIHRGWDGPETVRLAWPTGKEGAPPGYGIEPIEGTPTITRLIPFNTGDRVLLVGPDGVFVLDEFGAHRLLPTEEEMRGHFEWQRKERPNELFSYGLSMEHGAISPDGTLIAVGHQSSRHYLFNASSLDVIGVVGPLIDYPHHAAFSQDGTIIALNSCHFYSGITLGVPTDLLPGLQTEDYKLDDRLIPLEDGARVYAAASRGDEFIIGDASGHLRAFDLRGKFRWQHFIGSTVGDIDVSRDGSRLVVTTYAGFLCILDLDTGEADRFAISSATHIERRRWLFWKNEPNPLVW